MNLKEAFRAQNKLQSLMDEAGYIIQDRDNTLKVATTHLRSKVMPERRCSTVCGKSRTGGRPPWQICARISRTIPKDCSSFGIGSPRN